MQLSDIEDQTVAENAAKKYIGIVIPSVAGAQYEELATPCTCPDRILYHGHLPGKRNHFYTSCKAHGVQDCGIARIKQQLTTADDPDRTHRRRVSGATTSAWYTKRGR